LVKNAKDLNAKGAKKKTSATNAEAFINEWQQQRQSKGLKATVVGGWVDVAGRGAALGFRARRWERDRSLHSISSSVLRRVRGRWGSWWWWGDLPEVVEMEDAEDGSVDGAVFGDDERGDLVLLHEQKRVDGESFRRDGAGLRVHDVRRFFVEGVRAVALEQAAEIAVGEDAE
jgi:hypothetical protein